MICKFCGKRFKNSQAVKAHLQFCGSYHEALATRKRKPRHAQAMPKRIREEIGDLDMMISEDLDVDERQEFREPGIAVSHEQLKAAQQRRKIIQEIKDEVITNSLSCPPIPDALKVRIRQQIENELGAMPYLNEIPRVELVEHAQHIRDQICHAVEESRKQAERDEEEQRQEEQAERERTSQLMAWGADYAREALREEGVEGLKALRLQSKCEAAMKDELEEDEDLTRRDVEDIVDEILDEELGDEEDE